MVIAAALVLGVGHYLLWRWLAPGIDYWVAGDGTAYRAPTSSQHEFVGVFVFAVIGMVIGAAGGAVLWQLRRLRGMTGLLLTMGAAAVSAATARLLAEVIEIEPTVTEIGSQLYFQAPPVITTWVAMIGNLTAATVTYTVAVFLQERSDLGRPRAGRSQSASAAVAPSSAPPREP